MRRKARPGGGRQLEIEIDSIGGRGDGVARLDDGRPVYVPQTLPGDRLRVRLVGERAGAVSAEIVELLAEGPGRSEPPCRHFGPCGGCSLQHLAPDRYLTWKRDLLITALERRGFSEVPVGDLVTVAPDTRRRAVLAARRNKDGGVVLGFHGRASHSLVDVTHCLLLTPGLQALLPALRAALAAVLEPGDGAQVIATETETGIDVLLVSSTALDLAGREALAALAQDAKLARLSWRAPGEEIEPLAVLRDPLLRFGAVAVTPPPGGFVQPTAEGEAALAEVALAAVETEQNAILDLFAGCGTFAFRLATGDRRVHAIEGDADAVSALQTAARAAGLEGRVGAEQRDLERRPIAATDLNAYDAVLFDPPRAGAKAQAGALAGSQVPLVLALSCNPNSFARDVRTLVEGGYRLEQVTPIDQFPWSGHLEMAAVLRR